MCVQATIKRAVCTRIEIRSRRFEHFIRSSVTGKLKYLGCTFTRCFFIYLFIYFNAANSSSLKAWTCIYKSPCIYIVWEKRCGKNERRKKSQRKENFNLLEAIPCHDNSSYMYIAMHLQHTAWKRTVLKYSFRKRMYSRIYVRVRCPYQAFQHVLSFFFFFFI